MRLIEHTPKRWAGFIKTRSPILESIVPLNSQGNRDWASMSDDELVSFAQRFMKERGISGRRELQKTDSGLYCALLAREKESPGIMDMVFGKQERKPKGFYARMSDDELVAFVQRFMKERGISGRKELQKADNLGMSLYSTLLKRERKSPGVMDMVFGKRDVKPRGFYSKMSDDELVAFVQRFMKERGISEREELKKAEGGLYLALLKREKKSPGITGRVFGKQERKPKGFYSKMGDGEFVVFVQEFMKGRGISGRKELVEAGEGAYDALLRRKKKSPGIMDMVFGKQERKPKGFYARMSDDELVAFVQRFMKERGISGRKELADEDEGLYSTLLARERKSPGITERVFGRRDVKPRGFYSKMSDDELVAFVQRFVKERGISGREELKKAEGGLHNALWKRKLLDRVFRQIDGAKLEAAANAVIEAVLSFGEDE